MNTSSAEEVMWHDRDLYWIHNGWGQEKYEPGKKQRFGMEYLLDLMKAYGLELGRERILWKANCKKLKQERWYHLGKYVQINHQNTPK